MKLVMQFLLGSGPGRGLQTHSESSNTCPLLWVFLGTIIETNYSCNCFQLGINQAFNRQKTFSQDPFIFSPQLCMAKVSINTANNIMFLLIFWFKAQLVSK